MSMRRKRGRSIPIEDASGKSPGNEPENPRAAEREEEPAATGPAEEVLAGADAPEMAIPPDALPGADAGLIDWVNKNPTYRLDEIRFLLGEFGGSMLSVDASGNIQQPFMVGQWTFLLVIDRQFPKAAEQGDNVKAYFVVPTAPEIATALGLPSVPFAATDADGNSYMVLEHFEENLEAYLSGRSRECLSEQIVKAAKSLHDRCLEEMARKESQDALAGRRIITSSKYSDARSGNQERAVNPRCTKVVLSDRAFIQIYNETQARINTETGGLLLGHYEDGVWYVVEASDPGWNAVFQVSYHEADEDYENHVCSIMSRTYKHPLAFLGMWHRHPGSLDTFSGTDDQTNSKYVDACGNGCISALINYDPDFRITFYYVERAENGGVRYSQVDVECGDSHFANPEMLAVASREDADARIAHERQEAPREERGRRGRRGLAKPVRIIFGR